MEPDDAARAWNDLLASDESKDESTLQQFLEQHPEFLPGAHGPLGNSGHPPWPGAVISQPPLPDLSTKVPDFMWIAVDSARLYPMLIEIETPWKQWWQQKAVAMHSDLTKALSQVMHWRRWFQNGANQANFYRTYRISRAMQDLTLTPHYIVVHGRRSESDRSPETIAARGSISVDSDTSLMTFDRLGPDQRYMRYGTVQVGPAGFAPHRLSPDRSDVDAEAKTEIPRPSGYRFTPPPRRSRP